jgi:hypothetical protein
MPAPDFTIEELRRSHDRSLRMHSIATSDNGRCAIAQFLLATGRAQDPNVASTYWDDLRGDNYGPIPRDINAAVYADDRADLWTFGALVERLELLLPAKPVSDTWTRPDAYLTDMVEA